MKRFSDFAKENISMVGDKIKIDEVLNKEILVTDCRITDSIYKKDGNEKVLTLQFELNGKKHILFTGSSVLMGQAEKYRDEMPFLTIINKVNKFYTFT